MAYLCDYGVLELEDDVLAVIARVVLRPDPNQSVFVGTPDDALLLADVVESFERSDAEATDSDAATPARIAHGLREVVIAQFERQLRDAAPDDFTRSV